MIAFIKAWGYKPLTCGKDDDGAKTDFFTIQTRAGHPVMVAYLAGSAPTGVIPVPNAASGQEGGHWSLVLATHGGNASVVEPNAPNALKIWSINALLLANAAIDSKIFDRYWAKTESEFYHQDPNAFHPRLNPSALVRDAVGKNFEIGVKPVPNPGTWNPNLQGTWTPLSPIHVKRTTETRLYDLGGESGTRHLRQKLNHVVIAVLPPD